MSPLASPARRSTLRLPTARPWASAWQRPPRSNHQPVVQLSINVDKSLDFHLELGVKLTPLRERGVLVLASGNVVHNLRGMQWSLKDDGFDWARRSDAVAEQRMLTTPTEFATLDAHAD